MMQGPPPPPPGKAPPPPPPGKGALGVAAPVVTLTPDQEKKITVIVQQAEALKQRAESGDKQAQEDLKALLRQHEDEYSDFQRRIYNPLKNQIQAIKDPSDGQIAKLKKQGDENKKAFEARMSFIKAKTQKYAEQKAQFATIPGIPQKILTAIDLKILSLDQEMQQIPARVQAVSEKLQQDSQALNQQMNALTEQKKALDPNSLFLKTKFDVLKRFKERAADATLQREPINLAKWASEGFISGILFDNLVNFMVLEDEKNDVDEKYPPKRVYKIYTDLAQEKGFDETLIMAIATGLITRPAGQYCVNHRLPSLFLQGAVEDRECLPFFEYQLDRLYQGDPNLALTAGNNVSVQSSAAAGAPGQVTLNMRVILDSVTDMVQAVPATSRQASAAPSAAAAASGGVRLQPSVASPGQNPLTLQDSGKLGQRKGADIAAQLEIGREQALQAAIASDKALGMQYGKGPQAVAAAAQKAVANIQNNLQIAQAGLDALDKLTGTLSEFEEYLGIEVEDSLLADTSLEARLQRTQSALEAALTPETILKKDKVAGLQKAYDLYKKQHGGAKPTPTVLHGWRATPGFTRDDKTKFDQEVKKLK